MRDGRPYEVDGGVGRKTNLPPARFEHWKATLPDCRPALGRSLHIRARASRYEFRRRDTGASQVRPPDALGRSARRRVLRLPLSHRLVHSHGLGATLADVHQSTFASASTRSRPSRGPSMSETRLPPILLRPRRSAGRPCSARISGCR